jgi:hypothetical protein
MLVVLFVSGAGTLAVLPFCQPTAKPAWACPKTDANDAACTALQRPSVLKCCNTRQHVVVKHSATHLQCIICITCFKPGLLGCQVLARLHGSFKKQIAVPQRRACAPSCSSDRHSNGDQLACDCLIQTPGVCCCCCTSRACPWRMCCECCASDSAPAGWRRRRHAHPNCSSDALSQKIMQQLDH